MALNQLPDFSYRGEVPTAAIINAYQQKAAQEEQMRMNQEALKQQKINNVAEVFKAGAGIVNGITQFNKQEQMKDAQAAIMDLFRSGTNQVLTGQTTPAKSGMFPQMTEAATTQDYSKTPEYRQELQALITQADPEAAGEQIAKQAFNPQNQRGLVSGRDIQQFYLVSPDGQQRIPVNYDEVTQDLTNLVTQEPIDRQAHSDWQMVRNTPQVRTDAAGNHQIIDPILGKETNRVSSGAVEAPERLNGKVTEINHWSIPKEDRKVIVGEILEIQKDPVVKNAKQTVTMLTNVEKMLQTNNKIAVDRLGGLTQKLVALDSGNLAAWEQRDPNARDYISRIQQFYTMSTKGELSPKAKKEFQSLLKTTRENLAANVTEAAGMKIDSLTELYPQLNKKAMYKKAGLENYLEYVNPNTNFSTMSTEDLFKALGNQ